MNVETSPLFRTQWGVVQKIKFERPELMPQLNWTRRDAEDYRFWLIGRDENVRIAAEEEEARNFPSGNRIHLRLLYQRRRRLNYFMWHYGFSDRALKDATYHLVARRVSDWQEIEE